MASAAKRAGALLLSACALALVIDAAATGFASARSTEEPAHSAALDEAIIRSAARHGVPESLVRRIVMRESKYNARARNHSYWGLMQISYPTAKSMGFRGSPDELLNPIVNLRYAVPYLANAFVIAGKRQDAAVRLYASGYYDTAKRRGLLSLLRTADSAPLTAVPDEPEVAAAAPAPAPQQDTGIFGSLFGPQQMQRDPQTEQAVYASAAPQPAPVAATAAMPAGKTGEEVALVTDKHGDLKPPKKWQHDGGTTVIARGEQGIEQVAAYEKANGADEPKGRHRSRKTTIFAGLDQPPATAQAYAAPGGQDPRLMQADSQAAIQQATSGQTQAATESPANVATAQPAPEAATVAAEPAKTSRKRRVARRSRHHDAPEPAMAQAPEATQPQQAAAPQDGQAPQPAPVEQAAADPQQQPAPAPQAPPAVDASGYPADAGGAAQRQADAQPDEAAPSRHKRPASRRPRPHKTAVAAQSPDDGKAQPAAQ